MKMPNLLTAVASIISGIILGLTPCRAAPEDFSGSHEPNTPPAVRPEGNEDATLKRAQADMMQPGPQGQGTTPPNKGQAEDTRPQYDIEVLPAIRLLSDYPTQDKGVPQTLNRQQVINQRLTYSYGHRKDSVASNVDELRLGGPRGSRETWTAISTRGVTVTNQQGQTLSNIPSGFVATGASISPQNLLIISGTAPGYNGTIDVTTRKDSWRILDRYLPNDRHDRP